MASRRCERQRIERLIAEHGAGVLDLRAIMAADRPRMRNPAASIYDRCGVHFPELPRWFCGGVQVAVTKAGTDVRPSFRAACGRLVRRTLLDRQRGGELRVFVAVRAIQLTLGE